MSFINRNSYVKHTCIDGHKPQKINYRKLELKTLDGDYDISFPAKLSVIQMTGFKNRGECQGCGQKLKKQATYWELDYYDHCINYCQKYQELGLISKCFDCKLIFVTQTSFQNHLRTIHQLRNKELKDFDQMVHRMKPPKVCSGLTEKQEQEVKNFEAYIPIKVQPYKKWPTTVRCQGCFMEFPAFGKIRSPQFYEHCVKECEKYKNLGS